MEWSTTIERDIMNNKQFWKTIKLLFSDKTKSAEKLYS